jgi:hypothetical protein
VLPFVSNVILWFTRIVVFLLFDSTTIKGVLNSKINT